ncbi:amino acid adenylation domain-containing protein [Sorangium sp. So ce131]|uniref:amino acid adenylation domain-containing protein n=1 Tax=Sorangium sp. So ce131 TaxID=3133282 RepID=UPI003F5DA39A
MSDLSLYTSGDFAEHRRFWLDACERVPSPFRLRDPGRAAGDRPSAGGFASFTWELSVSAVGAVRGIGGESPLGQDVVVLSALFLLLSKYTYTRTVAIATPPFLPEEGESAAAPFVMLAAEVAAEGSLREWMLATKRVITQSYQLQDYPLSLVDPAFGSPARASNILFCDEAVHAPFRDLDAFDLTLSLRRDGDGMQIELGYRPERFSRGSVSRFCRHLERLLDHGHEPARALSQCSLLLPGDEESAAVVRGAEEGPFEPTTLVRLFEEQVARTPDQIAVRFEDQSLTYAELNRLAANLAAHLREGSRLQQSPLVGVKLEKSPRMIVAVLAVLKAGGAYVPLDPAYPAERLQAIFRDSRMSVLLIDSATMFGIEDFEGEIFVMDLQLDTLPEAEPFQADQLDPGSLAYLIYTSGSTGTPKGVMIEHRSIVNTVRWRRRHYGFGPGHVALQFASVAFDSSVEDIFTPLSSGATLLLPTERERNDLAALKRLIGAAGVTHLLLVPSFYEALLEEAGSAMDGLVAVTVAGEACSHKLVVRHHERLPHTRLINEYGPTENAVCSTAETLRPDAPYIGIGTPIDHGTVRILDPQMALLPPGIAGQIVLGGPGLARGYWRADALTDARFVHVEGPDGGARGYLSGDLGCIREDGKLEFLGRIDEQIKVNGYRIEPGDVEHALRGITGIERAVVRGRTLESGKTALVAWFTAAGSIDAEAVKARLQALLPAFMVPALLIRLESFPRTPSGKIDVAALSAEDAGGSAVRAHVAPRTPTEIRLAAIWADTLDCRRVGLDDDFFSLRGDSINVIRLLSKASREFGVPLTVDDVYRYPTVGAMAQRLTEVMDRAPDDDPARKDPLDETRLRLAEFKVRTLREAGDTEETDSWEEIYPLTPIEGGMLFQSLIEPGLSVYHDQFCLDFIDPRFDPERFRRALALLYREHDMLRSGYRRSASGEVAHIVYRAEAVVPELHWLDLRPLGGRDRQLAEIEDLMQRDRGRPFDLARPGLLRFYLLRRSDSAYTLLNVSHHLILDGWSHNILLDALFRLYGALGRDPAHRPEPLAVRFADDLIRRLADTDTGSRLAFWRRALEGYVRLPLPLQRVHRPGEGSARVERYEIESDAALNHRLEALAQRLEVGAKHVHLAAFSVLLAVLTGSDDLTFGLVTSFRPAVADGDRLIGNFINASPFRIRQDPAAPVESLIRAVRARLQEMRPNEALALADIARVFQLRPDRNPFFDVLFNYIDFRAAVRSADAMEVRETGVCAHEPTSYALDVTVSGGSRGFRLCLSHHHPTYRRSDMERIARAYLRILESMVADPTRRIASIEWIDAREAGEAGRRLTGPEIPLPARGEPRSVDALLETKPATPGSPTERALRSAWTRVLGHDGFGLDDDFFMVGGHSIKLVGLETILRRELARPFTLMDLLHHPTIRGLAAFLDDEAAAPSSGASAALAPLGPARACGPRTSSS